MATRTINTKLSVDGEKEWKSQMSDVNSALKTLRSELALSSSEFRGQANSMAALREKQDILQRQYDQQREKVSALTEALATARDIYSDSPKKIDEYQRQLNTAVVALNNMDAELQQNQRLLAEAEQSQDGCARSIDEFGNEVKQAEEEVSGFGTVLKANLASEAVIGGVKALAAAFSSVAESLGSVVTGGAAYADDIMTMATVTGLSTDALQEYRYMAELTDVSVDTITGSLSRMIRNMTTAAEGNGAAADAFSALGISEVNNDGTLRSSQDVFAEMLDALAGIENETQRDAYAMAVFGRSAQDLNPLIAQGAAGISAFAAEAHAMGYVLDDVALGKLGEVDDAMQRFQKTLEGVKNNLGEEFAPSVTAVINGVTAILAGNTEEGIALVTQGVDEFGATLERLGPYAEQALDLFLDTIIGALPDLIDAGADILVALIDGVVAATPELVPVVVDMVLTIITTLLDNSDLLVAAAFDLAVGIAVGLIKAVPSIAGKIPQIISAIVNGLISGMASISGAGSELIRGLWNGISNMGAWIGNKIRGFGQGIVNELKDFFGIHSPATKHFPFIGEMSAQGLGQGFTNEIGSVTDDMANELEQDIAGSMRNLPLNYDFSATVHSALGGMDGLNGSHGMSYSDVLVALQTIERQIEWIKANGMTIVLDDGTIVGRWLPLIDKGLGQMTLDKERGL